MGTQESHMIPFVWVQRIREAFQEEVALKLRLKGWVEINQKKLGEVGQEAVPLRAVRSPGVGGGVGVAVG